MMRRCKLCGRTLVPRPKGKGRQRLYCDETCKEGRVFAWLTAMTTKQRRLLHTVLTRTLTDE